MLQWKWMVKQQSEKRKILIALGIVVGVVVLCAVLYSLSNVIGVRPSISLKPGTKFVAGGNGTASNPYEVEWNVDFSTFFLYNDGGDSNDYPKWERV